MLRSGRMLTIWFAPFPTLFVSTSLIVISGGSCLESPAVGVKHPLVWRTTPAEKDPRFAKFVLSIAGGQRFALPVPDIASSAIANCLMLDELDGKVLALEDFIEAARSIPP